MRPVHPVEPLLQSLIKTERHLVSEYGTKMEGVMDTIGAYPHFAMPLKPGEMARISGRDAVEAMYKASTANAEPKASRIISHVASDWYVFIENVPTRHWVAEDALKTVQTVTLFVTDDDRGITGEYAWQRHYATGEPAAGDGGLVPLPDRVLANLENHERLLAALCGGDSKALGILITPDCTWATRDYHHDVVGGKLLKLEGIDAVAEWLPRWHAALCPTHVSVLNRRVTDWFVFSEELWVVRPEYGQPRQCRCANIYPLADDGRFEAALGFGLEIENIAPSADRKLGSPYWAEPGVNIRGDISGPSSSHAEGA